ncbi:MAG: DNA gyrase C-terminal beta-propeller domain-containing protein, partial [Anaerolineae bacterium]
GIGCHRRWRNEGVTMERPDLSQMPPEVRAYIEALESQLAQLTAAPTRPLPTATPVEPSEPPTTINVVTISRDGMIKRTPRHLYGRQRRGGMGVFDLETAEPDAPSLLAVADESETLLLFSNYGRACRLSLEKLNESPVRARGQALADLLQFQVHERIVAALPANQDKYVALVSERGWVRRVRDGYLGPNMLQGMSFHNVKEGGYLVGACWTPGDGDLFIATQQGKAIRFMESQVPTRGVLGLRTQVDDVVVAVTSVSSDSGVFLVGDDGKGTIRLMTGFNANKAPVAGGKVAMKTDNLVGALAMDERDDILLLSRLGKIIRFQAEEVPPKEGVVQGVNCMALRADEVTAVTIAPMNES